MPTVILCSNKNYLINYLIIVLTRYFRKTTGFPPFDRLMVLSLSKDLRGNDGGEVNYETVNK